MKVILWGIEEFIDKFGNLGELRAPCYIYFSLSMNGRKTYGCQSPLRLV